MTEPTEVENVYVHRDTVINCTCGWLGKVRELARAPIDVVGVPYRSCTICNKILVRTDMEGDLYIKDGVAQVVSQSIGV